ncbi:hypothetical protein BDN70DRAFT_350596 [Pholiota conissans]|uniref:Uncharacterized protein n=1 Tax=Pholiota conissans TaxID=109636 RepID=A0A9P6CWN5_9AGAR|nr:hypothetical protein BDN70DRAFT_350596 [Pholiota conissans]
MPPNLTHLSLSGILDEGFIQAVLNFCPNLQLLVVNDSRKVSEGASHDLGTKIKDKRLVKTRCSAEHSQYWSRGPQWGGDFWKVCEDIRDSRQSR